MVTTYAWADVRDRAIHQFGGEAVGATTETAIIDIFERQPALVVNEIERVANDYASGKITTGWGVLKARLTRIDTASDIVVTDETERRSKVKHTEQWIRAAGKHFDSEAEILDELFGPLGRLRDWKDDHALEARMLELWQQARPEGEAIEQDAEARGRRHTAWRERMRKPSATSTFALDDDLPL